MSVFENYANYYNLLYKDKDYSSETEYLLSLIKPYKPDCNNFLEIGSGTGGHAIELAKRGYSVLGTDLSEDMLKIANERAFELGYSVSELSFVQADARELNFKQKFDAIFSVFHVFSYLNSNDDLGAAFKSVASCLNADGLFIFDFWYGPAVLTERPETRRRNLEDDYLKIDRLSTPTMYCNRNVVDVNFDLEVYDKATRKTQNITETHSMRYLFIPELEYMLNAAELKPIFSYNWMSHNIPNFDSWQVVMGAVKI